MFRNMFPKALVFVPFGLPGIMLLLSAPLTTLQCDRTESVQVVCQLTSSGVLGQYSTTISPGDLQSAQLEESNDSEGTYYRVVLVTKNGKILLSDISISIGGLPLGKREIVDRINAFIGNSQQKSLSVQQNDTWFVYPIGASLVAIATYAALRK